MPSGRKHCTNLSLWFILIKTASDPDFLVNFNDLDVWKSDAKTFSSYYNPDFHGLWQKEHPESCRYLWTPRFSHRHVGLLTKHVS